MRTTRLNIFQRVVRRWDQVHPYNAAQVLKIAGKGDADSIQNAWGQSLVTLGLGDGTQPTKLHLVPPNITLEDYLSDKINRHFDCQSDNVSQGSLRPFVLQQSDHHYMGVIYQHWIGDSVSIRMLLEQWFKRLHDPMAVQNAPVCAPEGGYWHYFGPRKVNWRLLDGLLAVPRWFGRLRRCRKIRTSGSTDYDMRFARFDAPAGWIDRLRIFAREHGITVNDLFLAAIAEACHRHVPMQVNRRRQDLAVGTIVDLRPESREDLSRTFGLFLGFTTVLCRPADLTHFPRLVRAVAGQTRLLKLRHAASAGIVWLFVAHAAGRLLKPEKTFSFYRKHMPLAAGISNINLNRTWTSRYHPSPLLDYIRISPTGPMIPLAFTPTTLGDRFHLGLSYRGAVISPDRAVAVAESFMSRLTSLIEPAG
ncbi:MAG: hypothetical protein IT447_07925 [Phycisphaerales bacterium]|jgi:hypothetical protein|nr:hypothetical protein [Phycisphaerales bacterium]